MNIQELVLGPRIKTLSIMLPLDLWKKLRRLQEEGKIKSIQAAVVAGLDAIAKEES